MHLCLCIPDLPNCSAFPTSNIERNSLDGYELPEKLSATNVYTVGN